MPRTAHKETRSVVYRVRMRPSERAALERRALELGLDASDVLRTGWKFFPRPKITR